MKMYQDQSVQGRLKIKPILIRFEKRLIFSNPLFLRIEPFLVIPRCRRPAVRQQLDLPAAS